jgi:hypothetical protein
MRMYPTTPISSLARHYLGAIKRVMNEYAENRAPASDFILITDSSVIIPQTRPGVH